MKENIHTIKILDLIVSENCKDIFIVTNYVEMDLKHALKYSEKGLSAEDLLTITFKFLCALSFMHKANVMHRDLKPGNILIDQDYNLFICDFGLARTSFKIESNKKDYDREKMSEKLISLRPGRQTQKRYLSNHVMTRQYRAPEVIILEKKYRNSADLWSAGCILAELIFNQDVYREMGMSETTPLFNGGFCEPLSPALNNEPLNKDQLYKIVKILGNLDECDVSFLT